MGSIICTSHFTAFLDSDRKLEAFKGAKGNSLIMFAEKYPE